MAEEKEQQREEEMDEEDLEMEQEYQDVDEGDGDGVREEGKAADGKLEENDDEEYLFFCREIVESFFPDVSRLQQWSASKGFLPPEHRAELWTLLLTGSLLQEDQELDDEDDDGDCTEEEKKEEDLVAEEVDKRNNTSYTIDNMNQCDKKEKSPKIGKINKEAKELCTKRRKGKSIIDLFCSRTNRKKLLKEFQKEQREEGEEEEELYRILLPLLCSPHPMKRKKASSCFYTLCTRFFPLYISSTSSHSTPSFFSPSFASSTSISSSSITSCLVADKVSTLLRVLVLYHFPLLAVHLGGIAPDWSHFRSNPKKVFKNKQKKDSEDEEIAENGDSDIEDGHLIPSSWIASLFAGSVLRSSSNLLRLWDWCICSQDRHIGVYLVVTLLGLFENHLRGCSSIKELQQWVQLMHSGAAQAFRQSDHFKNSVLSEAAIDGEVARPCSHTTINNDKKQHNIEQETTITDQSFESLNIEEEYDDEDDDFPLGDSNLSKMHELYPKCDQLGDEDIKDTDVDGLMSVEWNASETMKPNEPLNESLSPLPNEEDTVHLNVTSEDLELVFLTGWVHSTAQIIENTPSTFRRTLQTVVEDVESLVSAKKASIRSKLHWSSDSHDGHDESELDNKSHGYVGLDEIDEELTCGSPAIGNYEEETSSECSASVPSSPMVATPPRKKGFDVASYGMSIFNKGIHMLTQKDSPPPPPIRPKLSTKPRKWLGGGFRHVPCVGTSAEEVLPCICSKRRFDPCRSQGVSIEEVFSDSVHLAVEKYLKTGQEIPSGLFSPPQYSRAVDSEPFYFAIDCWAKDSSEGSDEEEGLSSHRLCKIPKALCLSYMDVMNSEAMESVLPLLRPLVGSAHIVLIGRGNDLIRSGYGATDACDEKSLHDCIHEEAAQMGALALALAKRGIDRVSILDGGYGSVLRYFWNQENELNGSCQDNEPRGFDLLFDVKHEEIRGLFEKEELHSQDDSVSLPPDESDEMGEYSSLLGNGTVLEDGDDEEEDEDEDEKESKSASSFFNDALTSSSASVVGVTKNLFKFG